jgi:hypothetical protein
VLNLTPADALHIRVPFVVVTEVVPDKSTASPKCAHYFRRHHSLYAGVQNGGKYRELKHQIERSLGKGKLSTISQHEANIGSQVFRDVQSGIENVDSITFLRLRAKIKQVSKEVPSSATHLQDSQASQRSQTLHTENLGQQFFALMNSAPLVRV